MSVIVDEPQRMPSLMLSISEVAELIGGGVASRTISRWVAEGKFPRPVQIGGRRLWRRKDVELFAGDADGCMKKFRRIKSNK